MKYTIKNLRDFQKFIDMYMPSAQAGDPFTVKIIEPKRWEQQAYFEIITKIFTLINLDREGTTAEIAWFREKLKVEAGHSASFVTPQGPTKFPRSMIELDSVEKMNQFMENVKDVFDNYGVDLPDPDEYKSLKKSMGSSEATKTIMDSYKQKLKNKSSTMDF